MRQKNKQSGFTLIELIISIAIIGVMSGLVLANYNKSNVRTDFDRFYFSVVNMLHQTQQFSLSGDRDNATLGGGAWGYVVQHQPYGTVRDADYILQPGMLYEKKVGFSKISDEYIEAVINSVKIPTNYTVSFFVCTSDSSPVCTELSQASWHNILFTSPYGRILAGASEPGYGLKDTTVPYEANKIVMVEIETLDGSISKRIVLNGVINRVNP